jgi:hypothetical protein
MSAHAKVNEQKTLTECEKGDNAFRGVGSDTPRETKPMENVLTELPLCLGKVKSR